MEKKRIYNVDVKLFKALELAAAQSTIQESKFHDLHEQQHLPLRARKGS